MGVEKTGNLNKKPRLKSWIYSGKSDGWKKVLDVFHSGITFKDRYLPDGTRYTAAYKHGKLFSVYHHGNHTSVGGGVEYDASVDTGSVAPATGPDAGAGT